MSRNLINAKLSDEDMKFISDSFRQMRQRMPFAVTLTDDEKEDLLRLSDKNRMFTKKALETIDQHPDVLPPRFDVEALRNDAELHSQLFSILQQAQLFVEMLEDTYRLSGSEAYTGALSAYKFLKEANATTGDLDAALDELGKLFIRKLLPPKPTP